MAMKKRFCIGEVSREDILLSWQKEAGVKLDRSCVRKISDAKMRSIAGDMGDSIGEGANFWGAMEAATEEIIERCKIRR